MHHELFEKHIFCRYFISFSSRKICISNMFSDVIIISFQFFSELFFDYSLFITLLRKRYVKIVYFINSLWWIKNVIMALKINSIHFEENSRWKETCKSIWTIFVVLHFHRHETHPNVIVRRVVNFIHVFFRVLLFTCNQKQRNRLFS